MLSGVVSSKAQSRHNLVSVLGPDFRENMQDLLPTGNVDLAPTVASILGLELPQADGRSLLEALRNGYKVVARRSLERWLQGHLDNFSEAMAKFVSDYVHEKLAAKDEELAALRADLTVLRSIVSNKNVLPIRDDGVVR